MKRYLAVVLFAAGLAPAQSTVGSITGILTDPTGAVVPGAEVVITNRDTGIVYRTRSNSAGVYLAPSLIAGPYNIEVGAAGFKKKQILNQVLGTGERLRLDVALEVGQITERIEVQAAITPLMQESAEISETISASEIRNIPLNGRTPYSLLALSAGVSAFGNDPSSLSYDDNVSINGSRTRGNAFVIDGASTTHIGGIPERIGSIEAIHEFKVLASTYSAEYGRTSGGVVTFQVKSGTQEYHGGIYEYHRNNALNANNWENNARAVKPAALIRNEFGALVGGPAPGMNKKMFFFGNYEGLRDRTPLNKTRTIPDPSIRGGNFAGLPAVINDPLAGTPFAGSVIPQSRLDPAAVRLMQLFPQPNTQGSYSSRYGIHTNNWVRAAPRSDYKNFGTGRLDYNPTEKDKLFTTFSHVNEGPRDLVKDFDNVLNTEVGPRFRNIRRLTIGYTRFLRPNLTNEFLAFAQRDPRKIQPWFPSFDVTKELGIQRKIGPNLPNISIAGGFGSYGNSSIQDWVHQSGGLSDIATYIRGRHTAKLGGQLYQSQFWYVSAGNVSGSYSFNGEITGLGAAGRDHPINSLADLLLGAVKTASIPIPQIPVSRVNYNLGLFFNDDWKATRRLTLNLGLRYEFETHQIVKNNVYSRVDLASGELLVAGQNASRNLNLTTDYVNFSPRLGIAYSLNDKTVVRTGFGAFHSNLWVDNGEMVTYPGWTGSQVLVDQGLGRAQPFRFREGFPAELAPPVTDPMAMYAAATVQNPLAVGATTYDANDKLPYTLQWNLSVQREVGFGTVVDVAYVASRSVNQARTIPQNNPTLDRAADVVVRRVPIQQVRPFPRFSGFSAVLYDATGSYNSLQVKATRRFSAGLSLDANYTFSKNIDTASRAADSFQIPWQFANIERAISSIDRPHVFNIGWVYELPFGKGHRYLAGNPVLSALLGGFQVNGLFSASDGLPLTIRQRNTNLILSAQRPDVVDPKNLSGKVKQPFFAGPARRWLMAPDDPAFPFKLSSNLGIGNLGRNTSREPGFWNLNLSVFREFPIRERVRFELRFEAFNAFNHVNFLEPSTDIDSANYGLNTAAAPARQIQIGARISF
ncbi:MAG: TonB-dependent receptor [Acidobacteriota bacterium]